MAVSLLAGCERKQDSPTRPAPPKGTVYFVFRSEYEAPLGHRIVKFEADSVMDWFHRHWPDERFRQRILNPEQKGALVNVNGTGNDIPIHDHDATVRHIRELFRGPVYDMLSVWKAMAKWGSAPPREEREFAKFVSSIDYYGGPVAYSEHGIQVCTDDDEIEIAWYLFDDAYLRENAHRVAYLIREDWRLPEEFKAQPGPEPRARFTELNPAGDKNRGFTYCVFLSAQDGLTITEVTGAFRVQGIRVPEMAAFLADTSISMKERGWTAGMKPTWPEELLLTRSLIHSTKAQKFEDLFHTAAASKPLGELWTCSPEVSQANSDADLKDFTFLTGNVEKTARDLAALGETLKTKYEKSYWIRELQPLMIQTSPHMCQVRFHHKARTRDNKSELAHSDLQSFIFFDDLWMAANPVLAESILHYAADWDVLFPAGQ